MYSNHHGVPDKDIGYVVNRLNRISHVKKVLKVDVDCGFLLGIGVTLNNGKRYAVKFSHNKKATLKQLTKWIYLNKRATQ